MFFLLLVFLLAVAVGCWLSCFHCFTSSCQLLSLAACLDKIYHFIHWRIDLLFLWVDVISASTTLLLAFLAYELTIYLRIRYESFFVLTVVVFTIANFGQILTFFFFWIYKLLTNICMWLVLMNMRRLFTFPTSML